MVYRDPIELDNEQIQELWFGELFYFKASV